MNPIKLFKSELTFMISEIPQRHFLPILFFELIQIKIYAACFIQQFHEPYGGTFHGHPHQCPVLRRS